MKKTILIVTALLMVFSGVAAVSAYEAHVVDIKAHVENALIVSQELDYGITFPQEWMQEEVYIGLSESFMSENNTRVSDIKYALLWFPKLIADHPGAIDPDGDDFFEPIYPFLEISNEGESLDGMLPATPPAFWNTVSANASLGYVKWGWGHLDKATDPSDIWHFAFNVPVFDKWFNPSTDPAGDYPYVLYFDDDDYAIVSENFTASDNTTVVGDVPHADLGSNLKIQVYRYSYDPQ